MKRLVVIAGLLCSVTAAGAQTKAEVWKSLCGNQPYADTLGIIRGIVATDIDKPISVKATWIELVSTGKVSVSQKLFTLESTADENGRYGLCGVPIGPFTHVSASSDSSHTGDFDVPPIGSQFIARRDLTLRNHWRQIDSVLKGKVVEPNGQPLVDVEVSAPELGTQARTDSAGRFTIAGFHLGTQTIRLRKIGYGRNEYRVDVPSPQEVQIVFEKVTLLDSVDVKADKWRDYLMGLFEDHRRLGLGHFLTKASLDSGRGRSLADLVQQFNGLEVRYSGLTPHLVSTRGAKSVGAACAVNVMIDGVVDQSVSLRDYPPERLEGVEWYPGAASIPMEYMRLNIGRCGLLVLTTRR